MENSINTTVGYRRLNLSPREFRLVLVEPGSSSSPICCSLSYEFVEQSSKFEALSYHWGNPRDLLPIQLDKKEFWVTRNLASALRHIRLEDVVRTLWVDAICINQLDSEERSMQVQIMRDIYSAAWRTLVWLGPETELVDWSFEHMMEIRELDNYNKTMTELNAVLESKTLVKVAEEFLTLKISLVSRQPSDETQLALLEEQKAQTSSECALLNIQYESLYARILLSHSRMVELHQELENKGSTHVRTSRTVKDISPQWNTGNGQMWPLSEQQTTVSMLENPNFEGQRPLSMAAFRNEAIGLKDDSRGLKFTDLTAHSNEMLRDIDDGLFEVLARTWWERIWVIQEVAMAKDVVFQCGNVSVHWTNIYSVINHQPTEVVVDSYPLALSVLKLCSIDGNTIQELLVDLLQRFRSCEATNQVDKVYALLGLAMDVKNEDFSIDIDYTLAAADLYKQVVAFAMRCYKSLDVLGYVLDVNETKVSDLPSWCPDWSAGSDCVPFQYRRVFKGSSSSFYSTSGTSHALLTPGNAEELILEGYVLDNVFDVYEEADDILEGVSILHFNTDVQSLTVIKGWQEKVLETFEAGDPYSNVLEAFWRTIIADAIGDDRASENAAAMFDVWSGVAKEPDGEVNFAEPYVNAASKASSMRRLCVSNRKYLVLAPKKTQREDLICVLFGGQTPFVLRRNAGYFNLIGACYVHGIMDGESMQELQAGKYQRQNFVLR